jgi:ribulose-phosphate 3-epimerase
MKISPSILDADFGQLQNELNSIATANRIHLDIMDGHYVPNLSFGSPVLKNLDYKIETEVHLMVNNPENFIDMCISIGCSTITFHIENTGRMSALKLLKEIKNKGIKAGICVDGYTEIEFLDDEILEISDQILLMSVKAGFGGQSFMTSVLEKIKMLRSRGYKNEIEIDGGVTLDNVDLLNKAGADIVVVGSFLMKNNYKKRAEIIKQFQGI